MKFQFNYQYKISRYIVSSSPSKPNSVLNCICYTYDCNMRPNKRDRNPLASKQKCLKEKRLLYPYNTINYAQQHLTMSISQGM